MTSLNVEGARSDQTALAAKTGIRPRQVSGMENVKRPIGKAMARRLAPPLNADFRVLLKISDRAVLGDEKTATASILPLIYPLAMLYRESQALVAHPLRRKGHGGGGGRDEGGTAGVARKFGSGGNSRVR